MIKDKKGLLTNDVKTQTIKPNPQRDETDFIQVRCMPTTWMDLGSGEKAENRLSVRISFAKLETFTGTCSIHILQKPIQMRG